MWSDLLQATNEHLREAREKYGFSPGEFFGDEDPFNDEITRSHLAPVLENGRVVWSCFVKANRDLYSEGRSGSLGYLVFNPHGDFDDHPLHLEMIADRLAGLRYTSLNSLEEPILARFIALLDDDVAHISNERVPSHWADGYEIFYDRVYAFRSSFPDGFLGPRLQPLVIWPERRPDACLLPTALWPPELLEAHQRLAEGTPDNVSRLPQLHPPAVPQPYPQDEDYFYELMEPIPEAPPQLTTFALKRTRLIFRHERWNPREMIIRLSVEEDGAGIPQRSARFQGGWDPADDEFITHEEFFLVWKREFHEHFKSCLLHCEDNWMNGRQYRFIDAHPPPALPPIYLQLPGVVDPIERSEKFGDPIETFLLKHRLGSIVDAGTYFVGEVPDAKTAEAYLGIEPNDFEKLFDKLVPFLKTLPLPEGSRLEHGDREIDLSS